MLRASVLLVAFALATPVFAQPDIGFGFRAGVNHSALTVRNPTTDFQIDTDRRTGFEAAVIADLAFSDLLTVTSEVGYAHRRYAQSFVATIRANNEVGFIGAEGTATTSLGVASSSVLAKVTPFGGRAWTPFILAGPRLDVLLGSDTGTFTKAIDEGRGTVSFTDPYPKYFSDVSLSGVAGVGVDIRRATLPVLRVEARYGRTITNFFDIEPAVGTVSSFDLSVGVVW